MMIAVFCLTFLVAETRTKFHNMVETAYIGFDFLLRWGIYWNYNPSVDVAGREVTSGAAAPGDRISGK